MTTRLVHCSDDGNSSTRSAVPRSRACLRLEQLKQKDRPKAVPLQFLIGAEDQATGAERRNSQQYPPWLHSCIARRVGR
jgi:hypothetical protein